MQLHTGIQAAKRQTWKHKSARDLLADIIAAHPNAREEKWRREFVKAVQDDAEYFEAICDYAFDAAMRARSNARTPVEPTAADRAALLKRRADEAIAHAEKVSFVKEQIILLNQEMPNGKRARNCTLDYMYRLGGAFKRVGEQGSDKLVGTMFDEETYRQKLKGLT